MRKDETTRKITLHLNQHKTEELGMKKKIKNRTKTFLRWLMYG